MPNQRPSITQQFKEDAVRYALDHPDLVDSMYSYNTPYMGTSTAGLTNQSLAADTLFKIFGFGSYNGAKDLANSTLYNLLCNRWNNRYKCRKNFQ